MKPLDIRWFVEVILCHDIRRGFCFRSLYKDVSQRVLRYILMPQQEAVFSYLRAVCETPNLTRTLQRAYLEWTLISYCLNEVYLQKIHFKLQIYIHYAPFSLILMCLITENFRIRGRISSWEEDSYEPRLWNISLHFSNGKWYLYEIFAIVSW